VLQRILYVSRAAPGVGLDAVYAIIRAAHATNPGQGVSGALVCLDGWFAQIIEGPAMPLAATFAAIARDPRHAGIEVRLRAPALGRLFPGQAMALRYRACLGEGLLDALGYRSGVPVADFPADVLTQFLIDVCRPKASRYALGA
jgi:hypothetical protein